VGAKRKLKNSLIKFLAISDNSGHFLFFLQKKYPHAKFQNPSTVPSRRILVRVLVLVLVLVLVAT
jgi:hypothetical protein